MRWIPLISMLCTSSALALSACGPTASVGTDSGTGSGSGSGTDSGTGSGGGCGDGCPDGLVCEGGACVDPCTLVDDPCCGDPCCGEPCCGLEGDEGARCQPPAECLSNAECPDGAVCRDTFWCEAVPVLEACPPAGEPAYELVVTLSDPSAAFVSAAAAGPGSLAVLAVDASAEVRVVDVDLTAPATAMGASLAVSDGTRWVRSADFDGDGARDLLLPQAGAAPGLRVAYGQGDGTFDLAPGLLATPIDQPPTEPIAFVAVDLLPGGGMEGVFGQPGAGAILAFAATGGAPALLWSPVDQPPTRSLAVVDAEKDGLPDLVAARAGDGYAIYYGGLPGGGLGDDPQDLYDGIQSEGQREVASARLPGGERVLGTVWPYGASTVVMLYNGIAGPTLRMLEGEYAAGMVGLDAGAGEPARFAAWGPSGLVVFTVEGSGQVGCHEATVELAGAPLDVAAFDGQGAGVASDLAVVQATDPLSIALLRR